MTRPSDPPRPPALRPRPPRAAPLAAPPAGDGFAAPPAVRPPGGPPAPPAPSRPQPPRPPEFEGPPGVPAHQSNYLRYLPGIYQEQTFLGRFLLIFESVLGPIERTVDNIPHYFDPYLAPPDFMPWLASWLGLVMDERWPEERRRELVASAVRLYRWRGTARGLGEFLRLYTGVRPEITQPTLRDVSENRNLAFRFSVVLRVPRGETVDRSLVEAIVDAEKPAYSGYSLEIVQQ